MTDTNETMNSTSNGEQYFLKGMAHLKGIGQTKDEGLAAANLLDASDINHPISLAACALLYFCGIGVTRNTQTAAEFAQKYLAIEPTGRCARIAQEVIDGSLGSQNALKALHSLDNKNASLVNDPVSNPDQARQAKNKQNYMIGGGVVLALLLVVFVLIPNIGSGGASSEDPSKLFTSDEINVAKQRALERAGLYRTEARNQTSNEEK